MKTKNLLNLLQNVEGTTQLGASIVHTAQPNTNVIKAKEQSSYQLTIDLNNPSISKIVNNNELLSKILDKKTSTKSIVSQLTKTEFETMLYTIIENSFSNNNIQKQQIKQEISKKIDNMYSLYIAQMTEKILETKKILKNVEKEYASNSKNSKFTYVRTSSGNVNIELNNKYKNSKYIGLQIDEINRTSNEVESIRAKLSENHEFYSNILRTIIKLDNFSTVVSFLSGIAGAFVFITGIGAAASPFLFGTSVATAAVSGGLSLAKTFIKQKLVITEENMGLIEIFFGKGVDNFLSVLTDFKNGLDAGTGALRIISKKLFNKISGFLGKTGRVLGFAGSLYSVITGVPALANNIRELDKISENDKIAEQFFDGLSNKVMEFMDIIDIYKSTGVKWVVTNETKQELEYEKGGYGGKNLEFRNVLTGETFSISDLLYKTQFELRLLGLQKVYNPARGTWYVRTLKNNIVVDNLG
ncbi:hypothetical protein [Mycoplasma sp. Ms02]|uniref:hypothetical protein n=1 Tax=Mycoplasma sp. Ms02 TaxID=353851 RepID=UPI001C8A7117|nr:hypothetical protein [Mycoplasma sp. Ms02]QZE12073.1 hypothetical protein K4L35_01795 [Mycoplasma sp. Ms02]